MQVRKAYVSQLEEAAESVPCKLFNLQVRCDRPYTTVVLRPTQDTPDHLRKVGRGGRKVHALNWRGHKAFYDKLFEINPDTHIKTSWEGTIVYDGIESYKAQVR